jgi:hypothetical protein
MRPVTRTIFYCAVFLLGVAEPGRADVCRAGHAERVADEIGRLFNDLSAETALICTADATSECEILCTSPQKVSVDERRRDVLPLLTAVAGLAMRSVGKSEVSVISFVDDRLATQGRSLHLPAARALQLYSSLDDGTLDVRDFRANVLREFADKVVEKDLDKDRDKITGEVSESVAAEASATIAGLIPAKAARGVPDKPDLPDTKPIPLAALKLPPPRPRIDPQPSPDWNTASIPQAEASETPALSDVPLPRRRPRTLSRSRPRPPAAPPPAAQQPVPLPPVSQSPG